MYIIIISTHLLFKNGYNILSADGELLILTKIYEFKILWQGNYCSLCDTRVHL
jgi:hypothetical protein